MKIFILLFFITVSLFAGDTNKNKKNIEIKSVKNESINSISKDENLTNSNEKELRISEEVLKYFSIEGYFRTKMDYQNNLDLNSFYLMNPNTPDENVVGSSKHMPTVGELKNGASSASTVSYSTRFRFSPNIVVGEYLRAVSTIDIFDNQQYGDNEKSLIFAKEVYFEGKTPFGMISLGRIATNWGLGINRNSGKGKFANYGDYIDQIQYELKGVIGNMPNLSFKLAYEIKDSSPKSSSFYKSSQKPSYDIQDNDDNVGFSFYIENKMEGDELDNYLLTSSTRLNYGLYSGMYRKDKNVLINDTATSNTSKYSYQDYNLNYYTFDAFFEFYLGNIFNLKSEVVYSFGTNEINKSFNQWGAVIQSNFNFLMKTLTVGIDAGIASGDTSSESDPYNTLGTQNEYKKDNFVFNRDYNIDLIFFKEIYSLSSLYYIRPHLTWSATSDISLNLWSVTSIALNSEQTFGRDTYLGTEIDSSFEYLNRDGLNFGLRAGIYVPGAGMDWLGKDGKRGGTNAELKDSIADFAYSIQVFLIMKF